MSGPDIDKMRLTEEEREQAGALSIHSQQRSHVANAQLAKDWYGFLDWVIEDGTPGWGYLAEALTEALEQANVKRPTAAS